MKKNITKAVATVLAVAACATCVIIGSKDFLAITPKNEVTTVKLVAEFYEDGQKIYIGDNDNIELYNESDINRSRSAVSIKGNAKQMDTIVENGAFVSYIPLYDTDTEENEEYVKKEITIDNSVHTVMASDFSYIDSSNIPMEIYKNGEELEGTFDSYYLTVPSQYKNLVIKWHVEKEVSQTIEKDGLAINMNISTGDVYETGAIITDYMESDGDTSVNADEFCYYRSYSARNNYNDGIEIPYMEVELDDMEIKSMADGEIAEVNTLEGYVTVQYNDALYIRFDNVATDKIAEDYIKSGELLGIASDDTILVYCISNGEAISSEWLFDDYERPEEGPSLPQMFQMDEEWKDITYGTNTIGGGGCGPTNFAMIVSGLKKQTITPEEVVSVLKSMRSGNWYYVPGDGSSYAIFPKLCDYYDLNLDDSISTSEKSIREELEKGRIVLISVSAGKIYKGAGHFITIRGVDEDGNFLVNDSASYFKLNESYQYSDFTPIKSARSIW